jgi:hypothetical protein
MKELTLRNPIKINGKEVAVLTHDANEINGILFATAEAKKKAAAGMKNTTLSPAVEFDFSLHLYLGYAAIIAVNPGYDFSDLERIKGFDTVDIMEIGRNFIFKSEEKQQASGSDEHTETTPESTTQAPGTSKGKE